MKIKNVSDGIITISDIPTAQGGSSLIMQAGAEVTIFDEDADKSNQLGTLMTHGLVTKTGTEEPSAGQPNAVQSEPMPSRIIASPYSGTIMCMAASELGIAVIQAPSPAMPPGSCGNIYSIDGVMGVPIIGTMTSNPLTMAGGVGAAAGFFFVDASGPAMLVKVDPVTGAMGTPVDLGALISSIMGMDCNSLSNTAVIVGPSVATPGNFEIVQFDLGAMAPISNESFLLSGSALCCVAPDGTYFATNGGTVVYKGTLGSASSGNFDYSTAGIMSLGPILMSDGTNLVLSNPSSGGGLVYDTMALGTPVAKPTGLPSFGSSGGYVLKNGTVYSAFMAGGTVIHAIVPKDGLPGVVICPAFPGGFQTKGFLVGNYAVFETTWSILRLDTTKV